MVGASSLKRRSLLVLLLFSTPFSPSSPFLAALTVLSHKMELFAFPIEVRLQIYSDLLVYPESVDPLSADWRCDWLSHGALCPAILRTSKRVYGEAVGVLYSSNHFEFLQGDQPRTAFTASWRLFLERIGTGAGFIRRVTIDFPAPLIEGYGNEEALQKIRFDNLDLLRDGCPGITELKLLLLLRSLTEIPPAGALDLISTRLEALPSLRKVLVRVLRWEPHSYGSDDESGGPGNDQPQRDASEYDSLKTRLRARGWAVQFDDAFNNPYDDDFGKYEFDDQDRHEIGLLAGEDGSFGTYSFWVDSLRQEGPPTDGE